MNNPHTASAAHRTGWGIFHRFALVYAVLWTISWLTVFTGWPAPFERVRAIAPVQALHEWVTTGLLGLDSYWVGHVALLFTVGVSFVAAVIWFAVDEDRSREEFLADVSRTTVRYVLAAGIIAYGIPQVLPVYLRQPGPIDWITRFGEFNPRDIIEYAVGGAPLYESFIGMMHVLAGVLLFWRNTTRLGALLAIMATGNTAIILSGYMHGGTRLTFGLATLAGHFQLMALIVLAPDLERLLNFFVLNREAGRKTATQPIEFLSPEVTRGLRMAVIVLIIVPPVARAIGMMNDLRQKSSLYGVYQVEEMRRNGQTLPLTYDTQGRWRVVAIDNYADRAVIRLADGQRLDFALGDPVNDLASDWRRDRAAQTVSTDGSLTLREMRNRSGGLTGSTEQLRYRKEAESLIVDGTFRGDTIMARLRHLPDTTFKIHHPHWW